MTVGGELRPWTSAQQLVPEAGLPVLPLPSASQWGEEGYLYPLNSCISYMKLTITVLGQAF